MPFTRTKKWALALSLACALGANAQDYSINSLTYTWEDKPMLFTPDSADKANHTVFLLVKRINEYADNEKTGLDAFYVSHTIKYLNDDKSVEENNKVYVPTWESQNLIGIKTRVIKNGKVVFEATEKDFIQVEEDGNKYNMIALKGVEKGMLVETISTMRLADFDLYGSEYFQMSSPVKQAEFYLVTPERLEFKCKAYNRFGNISDSVVNNERHVYYGISKNIPAFDEDEKYSLENANKLRVEYVFHKNTANNKMNSKWPELGRIFFDRMSYNYDKHKKDIDKVLSKIDLKSAKSEEEKLFMIENYLKTNISVNDNVNDGETYAESFKKKVASPFRFNQIMAQTYRAAGINVEYVLTCKKDYKRFDPELDSWSYLRNVLFYSPSTKQFIDPQESLARIGTISSDFLNQHGLFVKILTIGEMTSATASIKLIPGNDVKQSVDYEKYSIAFNATTDKITLNYNREMNGYADQGIKGYYYIMNDESKKTFIEGFVKGLAKDATLESVVVENYNPSSLDDVHKPLVIKAKLTTDYYIEPVGNNMLFKIGEVIGQQSEMYADKPRINPIDIGPAHRYEREIVVMLPEGYTAKGLEKLNMKYEYMNANQQPSFGFTSSYKLEGNKLTIYCSEYYNDLTYPMEQFNEFKRVINAAADFNKISILLEKK